MFSLTYQERRVILFLGVVILFGMGINFLSKRYPSVRAVASIDENAGKINLNKADKELLMALPGIGEKLAQRIIEYREEKGSFSAEEELMEIKGITEYRYEKLKGHIYVR